MRIGVGDQGPVFGDGYFSRPEYVFTLGCEREALMRVYMKTGTKLCRGLLPSSARSGMDAFSARKEG